MATVVLDIVDDVRWREIGGLPVEISRVAIVHGLQQIFGGHQVPPIGTEAIVQIALDTTGVPQPNTVHPVHSLLILHERTVRMVSPHIAHIECVYRRFDLFLPGGANVRISGGAVLEQVTTPFDRTGTQTINVEHNDDKQTGTVNVPVPRLTFTFERAQQTSAPGTVVAGLTGRINDTTFQSQPPGTVLCSDASFELENAQKVPPIYRFRFVFVINDEGHNPKVHYQMENGRAPKGLVVGSIDPLGISGNQTLLGAYVVDVLPRTDFNDLGFVI